MFLTFPCLLLSICLSSSLGKCPVNTIVENDESVSVSVSLSDDDAIFFEEEDEFKNMTTGLQRNKRILRQSINAEYTLCDNTPVNFETEQQFTWRQPKGDNTLD
jgi:hypothetical protein